MGLMTAGDIVREGGLLAGDDGKFVRGLGELNRWLRSQYSGFLWPFLLRENVINVPAGTVSMQLGLAASTGMEDVQRLNDPIILYDSSMLDRTTLRVLTGGIELPVAWAQDPQVEVGRPLYCRVMPRPINDGVPSGAGSAVPAATQFIAFDKKTDQPYKMRFSYYGLPRHLTESQIPLYPNDRTMVQAVAAYFSRYVRAQDAGDNAEMLRNMTLEDRLKYGVTNGYHDTMMLDSKVYR